MLGDDAWITTADETIDPDNTPMEILGLSPLQRQNLERDLRYAEQLVGERRPFSDQGVQNLYRRLSGIKDRRGDDVIALGIAFGERVRARVDVEWVWLKDDWGEGLALSPPGLRAALAPISMIDKRLDDDPPWNLTNLANKSADFIQRQIDDAAADRR